MGCYKCKNPGDIKFGHFSGVLCRQCFIRLIEKRVRKDARIHKFFIKGETILVLDDGTENAAVTIYMVKRIAKHISPKITVSSSEDSAAKFDKIVIPWNLDLEVEYLLSELFSGLKLDSAKIKILRRVNQAEVELFAKLKGFSYVKSEPYNVLIRSILSDLEKTHPEVKFSLLKSFEKLGFI